MTNAAMQLGWKYIFTQTVPAAACSQGRSTQATMYHSLPLLYGPLLFQQWHTFILQRDAPASQPCFAEYA